MYGVRGGGLETLPLLTIAVVLVMFLVNPIFGFAVSRVPRRRFVPAFYRLVIAGALVFFFVAVFTPWGQSRRMGYVFFVWLSVVNLFMTSVFWQVLADTWTPEQAKRLYGLVGVGGTLGALLASLFVTQLSDIASALDVDKVTLLPWLLLLGACFLELSVQVGRGVRRNAADGAPVPAPAPALGGSGWQGLSDVVRVPYLRGICAYVFLFTLISTLFYYLWVAIVASTASDDATRVALFAWKNVGDQGLTLLIQLFFTGRIIQALGVGRTMAILPAIAFLGVGVVAFLPVFAVIWVVQVARRGGNFGLAKPARESLFSVLPREEKYKAKAVLDTFVYRAGDVSGAGIALLIPKGLAVVIPIAVIVMPLSLAWGGVGLWLGRQRRRMAKSAAPPTGPD